MGGDKRHVREGAGRVEIKVRLRGLGGRVLVSGRRLPAPPLGRRTFEG